MNYCNFICCCKYCVSGYVYYDEYGCLIFWCKIVDWIKVNVFSNFCECWVIIKCCLGKEICRWWKVSSIIYCW